MRNCHIRDFGRWKRTYSQAVRFHEGVGNEATHNLIHGTPHIAIQYSGNEHLIRYNEIFDSCRETGDAGVIMGDWGWDSRGNLIADNYLHDNVSRVPGRGSFNAVYLDGSCAGDTISGNIFYDSGEFGVMHNSGREVVIDNNIFVGGKAAIHATVHAWYDTTEGHAMNFLERIQAFDYRKPPWSRAYPALAATPDDRRHPDFERFKLPVGSLLVRNLSWRSRYWLDPRRLEAYDHYERIADNIDGEDPRFLDEAGRRLALRGDSPAWEIPGFRRIPFEKMGRLKRSKASRPHPPDGYDSGSGFRRTGGGGSGGMISLQAGGAVEIEAGALLGARGGKGGNCAWMGANGAGSARGGGGAGSPFGRPAPDDPRNPAFFAGGPVAGAPELVVSGGPGGYYAVDAVNNAAAGESGTELFFSGGNRKMKPNAVQNRKASHRPLSARGDCPTLEAPIPPRDGFGPRP